MAVFVVSGFFMPRKGYVITMKNSFTLKKCVLAGILTAIAVLLISIIRIPIIPAASFLVLDGGDIPLLLCGLLLGPVWGTMAVIIASFIQAMLFSADGLIGMFMHIVSSGAFVVVSSLIYKKFHTLKGAWAALISGGISMILIMIPFNLFITSAYYGMPVSAVADMLVPAIIPFNAIKAVVNIVIILLIYKPISKSLKKIHWLSI